MDFNFFANILLLMSACVMFGAALFLVWQAPRNRLNQLMTAWAVTVAFFLFFQLSGAVYEQLELDDRELAIGITLLWNISAILISYFLLVGLLIYTRPWTAAVRSTLIIASSIFSLLFIITVFYLLLDFPVEPTFDPISGIPSITTFLFDLATTPAAIGYGFRSWLAIALTLYLLLGTFTLPLVVWNGIGHPYVKYGVVGICITFILIQIPFFIRTGLVPVAIIIPDLLIVYAILDDNLFAPLKQTNEELLRNKRSLEVAYEVAEKEVNQQTKELLESLQREQQLSQQLEQALVQAEQLSQLKTQIIDNVFHEFRTPLTIINNSVEMLNRFGADLDEVKRKKYFERISDQIFYIDDLLQDILFASRANAEGIKPHWQVISFNELCEESIILWQSEFVHQTGRFTFEFDANDERPVKLDRRLFEQIGLNLLSNAIKYAMPNPVITVSLILNEVLTLQVIDNGIGVLANDKERIFDLFERGSNVETRRGMGLGLYTARQMTKAMGGQVSVISEGANRGSIFTVVLPVSEEIAVPELVPKG